MKAFFVISLCLSLVAVGHGRLLNSNSASGSWNSFLNANNIFPAHIDDSLNFNARDGLSVQQQLEDLLAPTPNLEVIYQNYLTNYNVEMAPVPLATRLELFKQFLHSIVVHNLEARAGIHSWTKGVTRFADRTPEELSRYLSPTPEVTIERNASSNSYDSSPYLSLYATLLQNAPDSLDYRDDGIVTPVKDQAAGCEGGAGACYAFAATSTAESAYARKYNKKQISLSEYEIISCGNGAPGLAGCDGGDLEFTLRWMKKGLAVESDMPAFIGTKKGDMPCPADASSKAHIAKVLAYQDVDDNNGAEDKLLALLLAHGPVGVGVGADAGWFAYTKGSGVYDGSCAPSRNHSVLIVGYTPDAWIVKNSWGTSWGDGGYMLIKRGVNKCFLGTRLRAITKLE